MAGRVIVTNAGNLAARWRMRAQAITPAMVAAERQNIEAARKLAIEASSGAFYKGGGLRIGGKVIYPYSKRTPMPPGPPGIANAQTRLMRRSWRTTVRANNDAIAATLYNTAPYSQFFNGQPTSRMMARPLLQDVMAKMRSPRLKKLAAAKAKALAIGADEGGSGAGLGPVEGFALMLVAGTLMGGIGGLSGK